MAVRGTEGRGVGGRISIVERLGAQATSSTFQTPSSKTDLRCLPRLLFLGFGVSRFGTSPELGVWCLVFRSAVAQKPRYARGWGPVVFGTQSACGFLLSLPARNERGESRREGKLIKSASSPRPFLLLRRRRRANA